MNPRKLLPEAWRFLLHGLLFFPAFVLCELWLDGGAHPWKLTLMLLPGLLSYPVARSTLKLTLRGSLIPAVLTALAAGGASAGISLLLGGLVPLWVALSAAAAVALFYFFRLYTPEVGAVRFACGVLLYLLVAVCVFFHPEPFAPYPAACDPLAILFVVLGVFSLGDVNLRNGMRADDGKAVFPGGMRTGTAALIAGVLALALILANLGTIRDLILAGVNCILFLVARLIDLLVALTRPHGGVTTPEPQMDIGAYLGEMEGEVSPFFLWFVIIFGTLALIAMAIGVLIYAVKALRYLYRKLKDLLEYLHQTGTELEDLGFRDERESLLDSAALLDPLRRAVLQITHRFRREPELDPNAPAREQLRFVYRRFLQRRQERGPELQALTPREAMKDLRYAPPGDKEQAARFAEAYDRARYSSHELSQDDAVLAQKLNEEI